MRWAYYLYGWTEAATALVGISGGLLAAVGATNTYGTNRRAQYDRVLAETSKLTTGDIANSGTVWP